MMNLTIETIMHMTVMMMAGLGLVSLVITFMQSLTPSKEETVIERRQRIREERKEQQQRWAHSSS